MALIKPFLGGNIRRKLIVIDSNPLIDREEEIVEEGKYSKLHKLIPPGHLPVDYNGYYSMIHVLTANLIHDLIKYESSILNHWNKDLMVADRRTVSNEGMQDDGMLERLEEEEAERMDREGSKNEVMIESKRRMEAIKDRRIEERMITIEIEREEEEIEEYDLNNNNLKWMWQGNEMTLNGIIIQMCFKCTILGMYFFHFREREREEKEERERRREEERKIWEVG